MLVDLIFIVGGNGLAGSAIVRYAKLHNLEYDVIQRQNKESFFGKSCDVLIFANGNPLKYKANQDPYFDFKASVESVSEYIHKINFKKFVLISTIDVYDKKSKLEFTLEDRKINTDYLQPYGYDKLLAENYVRHFCDEYLIFRLSGLTGIGLKKNPAFDFIDKDSKVMISPESELNFINTRLVADSIFKILDEKISNQTFNLASKNSIKIRDIKKIIRYDSEYTKDSKNFIQNYQINTEKIQKYVELSSSEEALSEYFLSLQN